MKLVTKKVCNKLDEIIEMLESGETLLLVCDTSDKYITERSELNNSGATVQNCKDGSISTINIAYDFVDKFSNAACYTSFSYKVEIYEQ